MVAPVPPESLQVQSDAARSSLAKVTELSTLLLAAPATFAQSDVGGNAATNLPTSDSNSNASYDGLRKSLRDCIDALEASATKVAVGIESMSTLEQADALLKSFIDPFSHFSTFAFLVSHQPVCSLLERSTHDLLENVCAVSKGFLSAIVENRRPDILVSVAKLGELKGVVAKLPMTNRAAVKRHCLESVAPIKDTIEEFKEVLEDAREMGFASTPRDGQDEEGESYLDERFSALDGLDDEELSEAEGRTVEVALELLADTKRLIQCAAIAVNSVAPTSETASENLSWLNEITQAVSALVRGVALAGAELYPSHDTIALTGAIEDLLAKATALGQAVLAREQVASLAECGKVMEAVKNAESSVVKHVADVLVLVAASEAD
jgi:hypothetical protein